MNFDSFQIQKWMVKTVRAEKVDEKNRVICLVSMFPSWVMVLKLSKKCNFLQFCADLSKKPINCDISLQDSILKMKGFISSVKCFYIKQHLKTI